MASKIHGTKISRIQSRIQTNTKKRQNRMAKRKVGKSPLSYLERSCNFPTQCQGLENVEIPDQEKRQNRIGKLKVGKSGFSYIGPSCSFHTQSQGLENV